MLKSTRRGSFLLVLGHLCVECDVNSLPYRSYFPNHQLTLTQHNKFELRNVRYFYLLCDFSHSMKHNYWFIKLNVKKNVKI